MNELFQIFFQIILYLLLFSFPLNCKFICNKFFFKKINLYDLILINIVLQSNLFLLYSFFNFNSNYLIGLLLLLSIIFYIVNIKEYFVELIFFLRRNSFNFFIFLITFISLSFYLAYNLKLGWDGIAHWFWKTQIFFQNGTIADFNSIPYSHYPHLGTYIWSIFWKFSFIKLEYLGRLYFVFFFLVSLFSMINTINSKYKHFFFILIPFLCFDPFAFSGYQEIMVFSLTLSVSRFFYIINNYTVKNKNFIILLIILSLNLIVWIKQEGIFISSILILSFLISFNFSIFYKLKVFSITLCFFIVYIFLEIYLKGSYSLQENVGVSSIMEKFHNIYEIFSTFYFISLNLIIGFIKRPILLLSLLCLFYLTIFNIKNVNKFKYIWVFFILNMAFIYSIYFTTSFPLKEYIAPTLGRLLLETSGFYLVCIVIFFDLIKKNKKNSKSNNI
jgi:hypothetical protein